MFFGRIFSRKKETAPTTTEALDNLRETEFLLIRKQEHLENKIADQVRLARQYGTKDKRLALRALRTKKAHENELQKLDGTLNTIQGQINNLESASTNAEVLQVLATASKASKVAYGNMEVEQIHELMEDIAEQHELADEIAQAISNPHGMHVSNDDELLAELELLEQEELDKKLLDVTPKSAAKQVDLPAVPTDALSQVKLTDGRELSELRAWANS